MATVVKLITSLLEIFPTIDVKLDDIQDIIDTNEEGIGNESSNIQGGIGEYSGHNFQQNINNIYNLENENYNSVILDNNNYNITIPEFIQTIETVVENNVGEGEDVEEEENTDNTNNVEIEKRFFALLKERNLSNKERGKLYETIDTLDKKESSLEEKVLNAIESISIPDLQFIQKYKADFIRIENEYREVSRRLYRYKIEEEDLQKKMKVYTDMLYSFQKGVSGSDYIFEEALRQSQDTMYKGILKCIDEMKEEIIPIAAKYSILKKKREGFHQTLQLLKKYETDGDSKNHPHGTCAICMENECTAAIVPCGHVFCSGCCKKELNYVAKRCPTCRGNAEKWIQLFF